MVLRLDGTVVEEICHLLLLLADRELIDIVLFTTCFVAHASYFLNFVRGLVVRKPLLDPLIRL